MNTKKTALVWLSTVLLASNLTFAHTQTLSFKVKLQLLSTCEAITDQHNLQMKCTQNTPYQVSLQPQIKVHQSSNVNSPHTNVKNINISSASGEGLNKIKSYANLAQSLNNSANRLNTNNHNHIMITIHY